jgi:hypothetical protein
MSWLSDIGGQYGLFSIFFSFIAGFYNDFAYRIEVVIANFKVRSNLQTKADYSNVSELGE